MIAGVFLGSALLLQASAVPESAWPLPQGRVAAGERAALDSAYAQRGGRAYWIEAGRPTRQALQLIEVLATAGVDGLDPLDYPAADLATRAARLAGGAAGDTADGPSAAADFDRRLTAAALRYALHLHAGRIGARSAGFDLRIGPPPLESAGWLATVSTAAEVRVAAAAAAPGFLHYRLLREALGRYRSLSAAGPDPPLPPLPRRSLRAGDVYAGTPELRRRLVALGDLPGEVEAASVPLAAGAADPLRLDAALLAALARFQARHGLEPDGTLGRGTLAALNVPLTQRVRQIELTLERWRWLPPFQSRQIIVNIPQFRLFALESTEDRLSGTLQMPVIAGRAYRETRTPVFTADIEFVVFRPYWDVPRSIALKEILPLVQARPGYLERNRMELVNGSGDDSPVVEATPENLAALERGELRLRQRPGEDNTLGLIKFVMPNGYGVYLHGTPGTRGFLLSRRDLSHGCIRVSDPAELAAYVLEGEPGSWTAQAIDAASRAAAPRRVKLTRPVHVMLLYGTALATEDGRILFFDDIYGLDRRLAELLRRAAVTS
ncbi:MAG: L,D-transpeptidase family protein [Gammaproteobacteria bacterium]|nr:L,D-transpeptidase family protein [Gammaproteobacteria bacterium]